ncbi:DMT family transporter [Umezawaea beigongshangensis]|uniref:DMT family transporter n=1 Tax=Umezawaea beigongshangensis TaxID=2780383 RepID=UPI0027DCABDA|nr:DMT family transporter [Umezawaea beigongshangensis]
MSAGSPIGAARSGAAWSRAAGAAVAGIGGVALAVQGRINGELGRVLGDGVLAALISLGGGLVLLLAVVPVSPAGRRGLIRLRAALRARRIHWWQCLGGTCGAFLVSTQGLTVAALGVAVFTVAVVAGQVASGLLVDRAGIGPGGRQPLTRQRGLGAALAVLAVGVAVSDEFSSPQALWLAVLPALAGLGFGWQQAVNGLVREAARSTAVTALVNFATGSAVLLVVSAADVAVRGLPDHAPAQWWLYLGGLLGVVSVGTSVVSVRFIGVLLVGLCVVAGQLLGAVLVDLVAPAAGERLAVVTVAGAVLTLLAVVVAALPTRAR